MPSAHLDELLLPGEGARVGQLELHPGALGLDQLHAVGDEDVPVELGARGGHDVARLVPLDVAQQVGVVELVAEPGAGREEVHGVDDLLVGGREDLLLVVLPDLQEARLQAPRLEVVDDVTIHVRVEAL